MGKDLTAELRWWWHGDGPSALATWFEGVRPGGAASRTDIYLLTGNARLGIKQRGGGGSGLEIKTLVAALDTGLPGGPAELWISAGTADGGLPEGRQIVVSKTRRQRLVAFTEGRAIETDDRSEAACSVELASVRAGIRAGIRAGGGEKWTSLCFEARATLDEPVRNLRAAWAALSPPAECAAGLAASYPAWLERFAAG